MKKFYIDSIIFAFLAAIFYGMGIPLSKLLLEKIEPTFLASFLYLGAGFGVLILKLIFNLTCKRDNSNFEKVTKKDGFYIFGMIFLDIVAPVFLLLGLSKIPAQEVSLLNNFEIVTTSVAALFFYKEVISLKMWIAILFTTLSSLILSTEGLFSFHFSLGAFYVLIACFCWGFENNFTRKLSSKDSEKMVIYKGLGSGTGAFMISLFLKESIPSVKYILLAMILGFLSYGLSINFYIKAQKNLGASKTGAYYSSAPFFGVVFSFFLFREPLKLSFWFASVLMLIGTYFMITDTVGVQHTHRHEHSHIHTNKDNTNFIEHIHSHTHFHAHNLGDESLHDHKFKDDKKEMIL